VPDRLRWGILGTGNIARQFATGVAMSRRGVLAAVGSRNAASAQAFAKDFGIEHSLGNYQQLITSDSVDVVYIALPNSMHFEWTLASLQSGKHVLCEKPLAANASQAQEMFDAAERHGRVLMEAFMYRSHPQTLAVIDAVKAGAIGKLKLIRTSFCFRTRRIEGNIRFSRDLAGGALMDVGCYCINFSRLFAQAEPSEIEVTGQVHTGGVDELAAGTMTFPGDIFATFACGMAVQADNTAYLCGSEGYIEIPVPWKPTRGNSGFTIARSTPPRMDVAGQAAPIAPPRETRPIEFEGDLFGIEADDFAAAILDGRLPRVSRDDSIGNMKVLDAMRLQLGI
jgi:predicted dehydrogenase